MKCLVFKSENRLIAVVCEYNVVKICNLKRLYFLRQTLIFLQTINAINSNYQKLNLPHCKKSPCDILIFSISFINLSFPYYFVNFATIAAGLIELAVSVAIMIIR